MNSINKKFKPETFYFFHFELESIDRNSRHFRHFIKHISFFLPDHQINNSAFVVSSCCSPCSVNVLLRRSREIEVDDVGDVLKVDSSRHAEFPMIFFLRFWLFFLRIFFLKSRTYKKPSSKSGSPLFSPSYVLLLEFLRPDRLDRWQSWCRTFLCWIVALRCDEKQQQVRSSGQLMVFQIASGRVSACNT